MIILILKKYPTIELVFDSKKKSFYSLREIKNEGTRIET